MVDLVPHCENIDPAVDPDSGEHVALPKWSEVLRHLVPKEIAMNPLTTHASTG